MAGASCATGATRSPSSPGSPVTPTRCTWRPPYVMVLHQAPTDGLTYPGFHFHLQILPPLRRPGLLKYLAGPEIGAGNFLNDTAPEAKAAELRAVAAEHYRAGARDG